MLEPPDDLPPEPGWTPLAPLGFRHGDRSFVRADGSSDRLLVRYFRREPDQGLVGKIWFGPGTQGPPAHAHGGSMASVLDDAMGICAWMSGHMVVAAEIRIRFRNMLPIGTVALLEASIVEVDGKRVRTRAELRAGDGTRFATGEGLFVHLGPDRFGELVDQARDQGKAPRGSGGGRTG
jgi:acyl-coenzyme A thioesterase PaaI-like protein